MSSSDEDVPFAKRNPTFMMGKAPVVISSDDDSPLPSWLRSPQQQAKGRGSDSDDPMAIVSSLLRSHQKQPKSPDKAGGSTQRREENKEEDGATNIATVSEQQQQQQPVKARTPAQKKKVSPKAAVPAVAGAGTSDGAGPSGEGAGPAAHKRPSAIQSPSHSVPVMIPEKLHTAKLLVELESTDELHGATDLSGDSGAIGRLRIIGATSSSSQQQQLQVDLKGVLYNASIVACPTTIAVVNVGQTEAKVECLFSEIVQLREDPRFKESVAAGALQFEDDEDRYVFGDDGGAQGQVGEDGKKKNAAKKAKVAGDAAKKPRGSGGVKKPAGKPRAAGKPKAKPKGKPKSRPKGAGKKS
jgi:hypothetical protein